MKGHRNSKNTEGVQKATRRVHQRDSLARDGHRSRPKNFSVRSIGSEVIKPAGDGRDGFGRAASSSQLHVQPEESIESRGLRARRA